jgi:PEP-CTERM motif-containing protein
MNITLQTAKLLCLGAFAATVASLHAQTNYHVSFDTSGLQGLSAAPFYADFQLFDGTGLGNANTMVTLSNFDFGGGSAVGGTFGSGDATGSLASEIDLTDSSFFNELFQQFTPGSSLQFDLHINSAPQGGLTPDSFAFAILDNTWSNLPTLAPGSDVFALVEIGDGAPVVETFASNPDIAPAGGGDGLSIGAPSVQAVPEPSTYGVLAAAGLSLLVVLKRRRKIG